MKIKTSLILLTLTFVLLIITIGFVMFLTFGQVNRKLTHYNNTNEMMKDASELSIVTHEYFIHHEKRMHQQWLLKYDSVGRMLEKVRKEEMHQDHLSILESLTSDYKMLGDLFLQLQANLAKRKRLINENKPQKEIDIALILEERVMAHTLMRVQKITSGAFKFSAMIQKRVMRIQQRAGLIVLFSIIGFVILSSCISFLVTRAITRPINKLIRGAEIIGKGDLEHKIDLKTKNEMGQLANSFNKMTKDLKEITVSRDELEKEVTERKLAEEALLQSEAGLDEAQRIAHLGNWDWNLQTNELLWSDEIYRIFGLAPQEFGATYEDFLSCVHPDDRDYVKKAVNKALENRKPCSFEHRIVLPNGEVRSVLEKAEVALGQSGKPIRMIGTVQDITERKQAHDELLKHRAHLEEMVRDRTAKLEKRVSEVQQLNDAMMNISEDLRITNANLESTTRQLVAANSELEAFSYSVSHDLRAPLRAIDGFSNALFEDYYNTLDDEGKRLLNVIRDEAQRMGCLIDDLLSFSRMGRKEMRQSAIDMGELAKSVLKELKATTAERNLQFKVNTLPSAHGDSAMIRQVFANLLSNAIKFTKTRDVAAIEVAGKVEENEYIYYVRDNGIGFDMKYVKKLFGVFQRLHSEDKFAGTGVGLAIAQRIIHRHGGRVWAEGKVNGGAAFYFTLPKQGGTHEQDK